MRQRRRRGRRPRLGGRLVERPGAPWAAAYQLGGPDARERASGHGWDAGAALATSVYAGRMFRDLEKVLISKERIAGRVHELAEEIARDLTAVAGEEGAEKVVLVSVLTGSIVFV